MQPIALDSFDKFTKFQVWFLSKDFISYSMAIAHLSLSSTLIGCLWLLGSSFSVINAKDTWSYSQPNLIDGTETLSNHLNGLGYICCSWVASCMTLSEIEQFSSDPTGLMGSFENSNSYLWESLELYEALRLVLCFWLSLQHWIFIKDYISLNKGTLFLWILNPVCWFP